METRGILSSGFNPHPFDSTDGPRVHTLLGSPFRNMQVPGPLFCNDSKQGSRGSRGTLSDYDRKKKLKFKDVGVGFLMLERYMF